MFESRSKGIIEEEWEQSRRSTSPSSSYAFMIMATLPSVVEGLRLQALGHRGMQEKPNRF
jgi:hypothetical protein